MTAHPSTRTDEILRRRLDEQGERLRHAWAGAVDGESDALRRVRVAARRLRATLSIAAGADRRPGVRRARRALRAIRRALGRSRELRVTRDELARAADGHGWLPDDTRVVLRWIEHETRTADRARRKAVRDAGGLPAVKRALAAPPTTRGVEARLATIILRRAARAADARAACGALYEPDRFHRLRTALKKLRYVLEIAEDVELPGAAVLGRDVARLQRRYGRLHDRQVLLDVVRASAASASPRQAHVLDRVAEDLETDCRRLHGAVVAQLGAIDRVVARSRRLAAALLAPAPARMTLPAAAHRSAPSSHR